MSSVLLKWQVLKVWEITKIEKLKTWLLYRKQEEIQPTEKMGKEPRGKAAAQLNAEVKCLYYSCRQLLFLFSLFPHSFSPFLTPKCMYLAPTVLCAWCWGYRNDIITLYKQEEDAFAIENIIMPAKLWYPKV